MEGRLISFEGVDGAGKSSHVARVKQALEALGFEVETTREPGGTPLGEALRELVLHQNMSAKMELMLMYAARLQHVETHIKPLLAKGVWVLSDRFEDSSYAYQVSAGGVPEIEFSQMSQWALGGFTPALTFLFDLPIEVSKQRIAKRAEASDRFEERPDEYLRAVRNGFKSRADSEPNRVNVIDATLTEEAVGIEVLAKLNDWLHSMRLV